MASSREPTLEASADADREQGGVDQTLGDALLSAGDLVDSVVALEFTKEQLDLPSSCVDSADVLGFEALGRDVGDVEAVAAELVVPRADDTEATKVVSVLAVFFRAVVHVDFEVDGAAAQLRDHVLPHLPDEALQARLVRGDDSRIGVLTQATEEKPLLLTDLGEENALEIGEVEDEQLAAHPRSALE